MPKFTPADSRRAGDRVTEYHAPFKAEGTDIRNAFGVIVGTAIDEVHATLFAGAGTLPDHPSDTVDALVQAESFMSGFEDDPEQEGVVDTLTGLRAAIQRERARPDLLAFVRRMAQFTTPEAEFEDRKGEDGTVYDDGISYESADELLADFSDERLSDEFATFCEMIQEARRVRDAAEGRANG